MKKNILNQKLHRKGKQWFTVSATVLALLGAGSLINKSANADSFKDCIGSYRNAHVNIQGMDNSIQANLINGNTVGNIEGINFNSQLIKSKIAQSNYKLDSINANKNDVNINVSPSHKSDLSNGKLTVNFLNNGSNVGSKTMSFNVSNVMDSLSSINNNAQPDAKYNIDTDQPMHLKSDGNNNYTANIAVKDLGSNNSNNGGGGSAAMNGGGNTANNNSNNNNNKQDNNQNHNHNQNNNNNNSNNNNQSNNNSHKNNKNNNSQNKGKNANNVKKAQKSVNKAKAALKNAHSKKARAKAQKQLKSAKKQVKINKASNNVQKAKNALKNAHGKKARAKAEKQLKKEQKAFYKASGAKKYNKSANKAKKQLKKAHSKKARAKAKKQLKRANAQLKQIKKRL